MKTIQRTGGYFLWMALLFIPCVLAFAAEGPEWQGFRGGSSAQAGVLPESFSLVTEWHRELGAGYSSVAVAGDRLITLFTSGADDVLAGFSAGDGKEIWRLKLADKYVGHEGSDDGPLASPMIDGDRVYALGPKGQLVAAKLTDGTELWRVQLDESNSTLPYYGYTASPLPVGELVVVLTGGEGRAISAFDRKNGELKWSVGNDSVTYQSPIVAELGGQRQIVAVTDHRAFGLEPSTGRELWSLGHSTGSAGQESAHPTLVDPDHLLINLQSESLLLKVQPSGEKQAVKEVWRSRVFANSLVLPVVFDGRIFGFTGRILSAVDPSNGEIAWRTRAVQALNLSLVDGRLVMVTNDGFLVVAKAGKEQYEEVTRLKVFERGDYADPAFADGLFFIRNQSRLAAIRVDDSPKPVEEPDHDVSDNRQHSAH